MDPFSKVKMLPNYMGTWQYYNIFNAQLWNPLARIATYPALKSKDVVPIYIKRIEVSVLIMFMYCTGCAKCFSSDSQIWAPFDVLSQMFQKSLLWCEASQSQHRLALSSHYWQIELGAWSALFNSYPPLNCTHLSSGKNGTRRSSLAKSH